MDAVLKFPGMRDVTLAAGGNNQDSYLLILYEPDESGDEQPLQRYVERAQILATRHRPTCVARIVWTFLPDPEQYGEMYDPDSSKSLATRVSFNTGSTTYDAG